MEKIIFFSVLVFSTSAFARGAATLPASFDYYLLSLSLEPAFCEEHPGRAVSSRECGRLTEAGYRAQPLTLHGLWPSRRDRRDPVWCGKDQQERGGFCHEDVVHLSSRTQQRLAEIMPGTSDCLERYEWAKHGTCSGLKVEAYFSRAIELVNRANRAIGRQISAATGNEIPLEQLRAQLSQADPPLAEATEFDCHSPQGGGRVMLSEVRIYFERDPVTGEPGNPLPLQAAGRRNHDPGCHTGRAYLDRPQARIHMELR
jgi:ribonuclease T2